MANNNQVYIRYRNEIKQAKTFKHVILPFCPKICSSKIYSWGREAPSNSSESQAVSADICPHLSSYSLASILPSTSTDFSLTESVSPHNSAMINTINNNSETDSTATFESEETEPDIGYQNPNELLREWALEFQATHRSIDGLLKVLTIIGVKGLPKDCRTLLKTPRQVQIVQISGGQYWHNGFKEISEIMNLNETECVNKVSLNVNMDGLPIGRSSKSEFWPILC